MTKNTKLSAKRPENNKFHTGAASDGKHYWLSPKWLLDMVRKEFGRFFDPCPYPLPEGFDGLTRSWGKVSYVNPPFGAIMHEGKKKGMTAWVRKALAEREREEKP